MLMDSKRFTSRNEEFTCEVCSKRVSPRKKSCRNHCPFCLSSKHIDIFPGDRANTCQGVQKAIGYENFSQKGLVLIFRCERCQAITKNIAAENDPIQADDFDLIIKLLPPYPNRH